VELPGIEPATEIDLTCGNAGFQFVKRRENTWERRKMLTASTPVAACELADAVRLTDGRRSIGLGWGGLGSGDDRRADAVQ